MDELQPNMVFYGRQFVRHIGICNPSSVRLLQVMSGVIPRNLKKRRPYLKSFFWRPQKWHTHTQTDRHTHDDSIRQNAMRCISPKNNQLHCCLLLRCIGYHAQVIINRLSCIGYHGQVIMHRLSCIGYHAQVIMHRLS